MWSGESGNGMECLGVASNAWALSGVSGCGFMSWSVIECLGVTGSDVYSVWALPAVCGRCQQCVGVVRGE